MDAKQAKFIEDNGWILKHSESSKIKPLIQALPLAIALQIWEHIPQVGITLQDLVFRLNLNSNTVAIATRAMEKAGLIKRCKNPKNRRQTLILKNMTVNTDKLENNLLSGVSVDSVVIASYHGIKRYGKVLEIDNDPNRSCARGNVLVEHFSLSPQINPDKQWYWGCNVELLTSEAYQARRKQLEIELDELHQAKFQAKMSSQDGF